jgi:hypothetical protein
VIKMVLFLIGIVSRAVSPLAADLDDGEAAVLCDDGSFPWGSDLQPNWACTIRGCSPSDRICWPEKTDACYDEDGDTFGVCTIETKTCDSRLSCFDMWLHCVGTYECNSDEIVGCTEGTCVNVVAE